MATQPPTDYILALLCTKRSPHVVFSMQRTFELDHEITMHRTHPHSSSCDKQLLCTKHACTHIYIGSYLLNSTERTHILSVQPIEIGMGTNAKWHQLNATHTHHTHPNSSQMNMLFESLSSAVCRAVRSGWSQLRIALDISITWRRKRFTQNACADNRIWLCSSHDDGTNWVVCSTNCTMLENHQRMIEHKVLSHANSSHRSEMIRSLWWILLNRTECHSIYY